MKRLLILAVSIVCLTSGCAKKYESVDEYVEDMKNVQQEKSYTLEFENLSYIADTYFRAYKKGNLWKYDQSSNHGRSYFHTVLFDGTDIVGYGEGKWASLISTPETNEEKELDSRLHNTSSELFTWYKPSCLYKGSNIKPEFVNNNAKKNGFNCRLIKYGDSYETCVSDDLGIAVYIKKQMGGDTNKETTINLIKADTTELPDSTFVLPSDKQKVSTKKMLEEMMKGNF